MAENSQKANDPVITELEKLDAELLATLAEVDVVAKLLDFLPTKYPSEKVREAPGNRAWELAGLFLLHRGRFHEALAVFWRLYEHMLDAQASAGRVHKGMVLLWISECFFQLGFPVHAKRYLMLTLCEDAVSSGGKIPPKTTGVYFRLVWRHGLPDATLQLYAEKIFDQSKQAPSVVLFPEALLQRIDDNWQTEVPSSAEALHYRINSRYARHLLDQIDGDASGKELEFLAAYLMSCMPGCRVSRRKRSPSTDYDVVCSIDGIELDFRSEFGRYFVCECKDWNRPADFTSMAKFCRVLDSTKSRFGILFSMHCASGAGRNLDAEREQLKVFQDRGIVIVVIDRRDLDRVADGTNLIALLRQRYEAVRLDLRE